MTETYIDEAFTFDNTSGLAPGYYASDPQGHALVVDERRKLAVLDMGGVITIGGVDVYDPIVLDNLGNRLHELANRLRTRRATVAETVGYTDDDAGAGSLNSTEAR